MKVLSHIVVGAFALLLAAQFVTVPVAEARTYVRDGDTIVLSDTPVRLEGLHCPELKAPGGQTAKRLMQDIMQVSEGITCQLSGKKSYDREIGYCQADGVDLGIIMIQSGHCQPCRKLDRKRIYDGFPVTAPTPSYCR